MHAQFGEMTAGALAGNQEILPRFRHNPVGIGLQRSQRKSLASVARAA